MSIQQSSQKNASVGQPAKYDELDMRGLYESPHIAELPVMAHIENATELLAGAREVARTRDGQPLHPTVQGEIQTERDYDWTRSPDLEHDGYFGETLAQQERRLAEERELERYREKALAAESAGLERERSARLLTEEERRQIHADFEERAALAAGEDPTAPDPREQLSQEDLAAVNLQAYRIAERVRNQRWTAVLSRRLAQKVVKGQSVAEASLDLTDELYEEPDVVQPIATVDPWGDNVDIEGTVTRLFDPSAPNIQQVGYVQDETGSVKVTIWKKSHQRKILHEGDRVRITYGKPGSYKGQKTLAVVYDSRMEVLEEGEGPAPVHGSGQKETRENGRGFAGEQRLGPCKAPSMTDTKSKPVPRSEAARFQGDERWIYPAEACPEWFREQENVEIYDGDGEW